MENSQFWYLQNIDVNGIFCPTKLSVDGSLHGKKVIQKGNYVYTPEDDSDRIFFLESGRIKIGSYGQGDKEIIKAILGKGEVFGELSLVSEGKRKDFAVAMEESMVCSIRREDMDKLFRERSALQLFFLNILGKRVLQMESRLENLVFKDSRSRIIEYLVELADKKGERVGYEVVVRKFLTHQEIANITATSRQTVTTVLNDLRSKEIIKFDRRRLLIRSKERLAKELLTE